MEATASAIEKRFGTIAKVCYFIAALLFLIACMSVFLILFPVVLNAHEGGTELDRALTLASCFSIAADLTLPCVLFTTSVILFSIPKMRRVFFRTQTARIVGIAVLFIARFALRSISTILVVEAIKHAENSSAFLLTPTPVFESDALVCAIVCLGLALLFHHGTMLQEVSDDTV